MPSLRPARLAGVGLVLAGVAASGLVATGGAAAGPPDQAAAAVIEAAREQLGDGYAWGGNGPDTWDCSGLTSVLWRGVGGVSGIPRTSRDQQAWATPVYAEDALPGDLVFFGQPVSHVSIYLGGDRIIDASSSRKGVVERTIWTSDVIRYGRVPRPTAPKSRPVASSTASASAQPAADRSGPPGAHPSTSPSATVTPKPSGTPKPAGKASASPAKPSPRPTGKPSAKPSASPAKPSASPAKPSAKPSPSAHSRTGASPSPTASASHRPVPPPGHKPRTATTREAAAFVSAARAVVGAKYEPGRSGPTYDAPGLVRMAWWKVTKKALPADVVALEKRTRPVALADLAVGDLVFYGAPAVHVGIYVGDGNMVDASKVLKKVSERRVFSSESVRFARITP